MMDEFPTTSDAHGLHVTRLPCTRCCSDSWITREIIVHVAEVGQHIPGVWSVCTECGYEAVTLFVPEAQDCTPLCGDHHLVGAD